MPSRQANDIAALVFVALELANYVALIFWLDWSLQRPSHKWQYSLRGLLIVTTIAAIELGFFKAFMGRLPR
jgi:cytochrome bd-type quinol oxidase subunit 1